LTWFFVFGFFKEGGNNTLSLSLYSHHSFSLKIRNSDRRFYPNWCAAFFFLLVFSIYLYNILVFNWTYDSFNYWKTKGLSGADPSCFFFFTCHRWKWPLFNYLNSDFSFFMIPCKFEFCMKLISGKFWFAFFQLITGLCIF